MGKAEALRLAIGAATTLRRGAVAGTAALVAATLAPACVACDRALDAPFAGPVCHWCWEDARRAAGRYDLVWNARDAHGAAAGTGVYFVRGRVGAIEFRRKVVLVR